MTTTDTATELEQVRAENERLLSLANLYEVQYRRAVDVRLDVELNAHGVTAENVTLRAEVARLREYVRLA